MTTVHLLNSKYIACELMYKINMFLPSSFVYKSVFLLIVYTTISLLKQVLLGKKCILFLDIDAS